MGRVLMRDYAVLNIMNNTSHHLTLTGLANHLVYDGLLAPEVALEAFQEAKKQNISFINYLTKNKILMGEKIAQSCATSFGLAMFDLKNYQDEWALSLNADIINKYQVIPLKKQNGSLEIGIADPTDKTALESAKFYTGLNIIPIIINNEQLTSFIKTRFSEWSHKNLELGLLKELTLEENINLIQENHVNYDEPLIRFVDNLIQHALQQSASDIHIEPHEKICRIRYRKDGILYQIAEIPAHLSGRLVTRLKVLAKLDISERRLPQDGRFQIHHIDIRANICPTLFGEKIVLRLLDSRNVSLEINKLGMTEKQTQIFLNKISQSQGFILVTGPTGSGKTATLYSALHYLNQPEKNISTIEDPVEIQLNGINQVHIHPKIGLHFSTILRTFLRQDPDIIMVGEIRDFETAEIAIQAAQTGHLVLSTLHTNNSIEAITRLLSMGIKLYNLVSSISLIIAQRLVRRLCDLCKQPDSHPHQTLKKQITYRAIGCQHCLKGYKGRIGIYELLPFSEKIIQSITSQKCSAQILEQAKEEGFLSLRESGIEKVLQGTTSLSEINRVIHQ